MGAQETVYGLVRVEGDGESLRQKWRLAVDPEALLKPESEFIVADSVEAAGAAIGARFPRPAAFQFHPPTTPVRVAYSQHERFWWVFRHPAVHLGYQFVMARKAVEQYGAVVLWSPTNTDVHSRVTGNPEYRESDLICRRDAETGLYVLTRDPKACARREKAAATRKKSAEKKRQVREVQAAADRLVCAVREAADSLATALVDSVLAEWKSVVSVYARNDPLAVLKKVYELYRKYGGTAKAFRSMPEAAGLVAAVRAAEEGRAVDSAFAERYAEGLAFVKKEAKAILRAA